MRNRSLVPIFLVVLVDLLGMMMIVPMLPFYAQKFGATPFQVGLLSSSFSICQLVASPLLGALSDRFGRKPILIVSQIGTLIGFILMAVSTQLWMVFLSRMIDGITAGNLALAQAYVADTTLPEERAKSFGVLGIALGIGLLLGPAISGVLAGYSLVYPIYAAIVLAILSVISSGLLLKNTDGEKRAKVRTQPMLNWRAYFSFFTRPGLSSILVQFSFYVFAFGFFTQGIGLLAERRFLRADGKPYGATEVGYLFAFCGLLGIFIQGACIGPLVKKFGEKKLARLGFISDAIGYSLLGWVATPAALGLSSTFFSFGNSTLRPTLTSLVTKGVSAEEQGAVLGLTTSLQCLGMILGPPLGGFLIERDYLSFWGAILAAFCVVPLFSVNKD